jgi:hypothetical protein
MPSYGDFQALSEPESALTNAFLFEHANALSIQRDLNAP